MFQLLILPSFCFLNKTSEPKTEHKKQKQSNSSLKKVRLEKFFENEKKRNKINMRLEREEPKPLDEQQQQSVADIHNNDGVGMIEVERRKRSTSDAIVDDRFDTMRHIVKSGRQEEAFFLCDQDQLVQNFKYWTEKMKNVTPYFGKNRLT